MTDAFEAKRAIHDSLENKPRESQSGNEDRDAQRAADKARRQAESELRIQAWGKRVADHRESQAQVATLRSSDIWNTNPENRTRTFISDELFPVQKAPGRDEKLDRPKLLVDNVSSDEVDVVADPGIGQEIPFIEEPVTESIQEQVVESPVAEVAEPASIIEAQIVEAVEPAPELLPIVESAPVETAQEEPQAEAAEVPVPEIIVEPVVESVEPAPELPPELPMTDEEVQETPPVDAIKISIPKTEIVEPSVPEVINQEIIAAPEPAEEIPVGEYTEGEIDPDQLPDEDAETSEEVEDGLNNEQDFLDSERRKEIEKNIAERRKETQKVMQELYSGLEELGNGEIQILEESFDSVAGIFHIFEEASFVMRDEQINQMTDELREGIFLLNDFKDSYASEQGLLVNSQESLAGMTPDEVTEFMGARAFQAEENENKARQIQAMLEEHLDRVIYLVNVYLDPRRAGNALALAEETKERFSLITRQAVAKRDKINETVGRLSTLQK